MRNPLNVSILTIVVVLAILLVVLAQIPAGPGSGESSPDLSGVWRAEGGNVPRLQSERASLAGALGSGDVPSQPRGRRGPA